MNITHYTLLRVAAALCGALLLLPSPLHGQSRNALAWHRGTGMGYHSDRSSNLFTQSYYTGLAYEHRRTAFFSWALGARYVRVATDGNFVLNTVTFHRDVTHHGLALLAGPVLHLRSGKRWEWNFALSTGGLMMTTRHEFHMQSSGDNQVRHFHFRPSFHWSGEGSVALSYWLDSRIALEAALFFLRSHDNNSALVHAKETGLPFPSEADALLTKYYAWWRDGSEANPYRQGGLGAYSISFGLRCRL